jgi:cation:H+ antiporter
MSSILLILGGLVLLVFGGELLVRGASTIAAWLKIPPLIIGLTVVAFGTSAPELGVSVQAALIGSADVAVGNVVGSNIFNVLLILGVCAIITPLIVASQLVRFDVPLMIGMSVLTWLLSIDGVISLIDGEILFTLLIGYIIASIVLARRESRVVQDEFAQEYSAADGELSRTLVDWLTQLAFIVVSLALLGIGSKWLVTGAVSIATWFGVSQLIIGMTIVAAGTSLPEVVTSVIASIRGERDIAVGNIVGSNIFNLSCVLGLSAMVAQDGIAVSPVAARFDMPVMIAVAAVCLPIFFTGQLIARWEGILFLIYYVMYTTYLILLETHPTAAQYLLRTVLLVVVPITALTIGSSVIASFRRPHGAPS